MTLLQMGSTNTFLPSTSVSPASPPAGGQRPRWPEVRPGRGQTWALLSNTLPPGCGRSTLLLPDLSRCQSSDLDASFDSGEEAMTMGFIIATAFIVAAALLVWWILFPPQATEGSARRQRRR